MLLIQLTSFYMRILPLAIRHRVLNEGKPLFVRDKRFVEDLRWKAFKEYIDFKL